MAARVFWPMARVFKKTLGEPGVHYWQRHDADDPDPIELIFVPNPVEVDEEGFRVIDAKPKAYIATADALAIAPNRADLDRSLLFSKRDTLIINGKVWRVGSCLADGFAMSEVTLLRDKDS